MPDPHNTQLYLGSDMTQPTLHRAAEGVAAIFTCRRPDADRDNEDAAALVSLPDGGGCVLVVADGVGGGRAGGKASAIAVEQLAQAVNNGAGEPLRAAILDGLEAASEDVSRLRLGAGATLAGAAIVDGSLRSFHVGDCTALVVGQRGRIKLHTVAHSPVGYAFEAGYIDELEAMFEPHRHLILNMIGAADMRIELGSRVQLSPHDTLVLGTDGLFDNLFVGEIIELVRKGPLEQAAAALAAACRRRMTRADGADLPCKPDDLTFALFRRRYAEPH